MIKEGNFGYHEAITLLVITIITKTFFTSPAVLVGIVGTAGWYMTLVSATTAIFAFMFLYLLLKRFPKKNIMEIADVVLGKWGSVIFLLLFGAFLLWTASVSIREFTEVLKVYVLPQSPPSFVMILFVITIVVLSFMGLETIARFAKFIIYILGAGFVLIVLFSSQNFVFQNLFPLMGYGLDKTLIHGLLRCSFYGEVVLLGVIASSLQGYKEIKRIGFSTLLITGFFTSFSLFIFTLVFPYTVGQELTSPMYEMAALINYGGFLQRMEPFFLFLWNFGTFIEVSLIFYATLMIFCHAFRIDDKRPIILPMVTTLYSLSLIPKSILEVTTGLVQSLRSWGWVIYYVPPIFILIIALIRKKKGGSQNA
ncbi:MAG: endospore germination permease [Clostridiaceae bacterium]|nr:endospore germination permease [Clostridiaceae bacterium]